MTTPRWRPDVPTEDELLVEARFVAALQRLARAQRHDQLTTLRQNLDLLSEWGALETPGVVSAAVERLLRVMPWLSGYAGDHDGEVDSDDNGDHAGDHDGEGNGDQSQSFSAPVSSALSSALSSTLSMQRLAEFALVGALFALYSTYRPTIRLISQRGRAPSSSSVTATAAPSTSFGATWRRLTELPLRESADRQFAVLLVAPRDALPRLLRHAIGTLATHAVPVDWIALLVDLAAWDANDRHIQRAWAHDYYWQSDDPLISALRAASASDATVGAEESRGDRDGDEESEIPETSG